MIFRRGKVDDIEQMTTTRIRFIESGGESIDMETRESLRTEINGYFAEHLDKDCFAFIAIDGTAIVGMILLVYEHRPANLRFPKGRLGEVLSVFTDEAYRGRGIATKLMHMLIAFGGQLGLDLIELNARPMAVSVYEKVGFEKKTSNLTDMVYKY